MTSAKKRRHRRHRRHLDRTESKPTMCLHCHLVVVMHRTERKIQDKGMVGIWTCQQCGHEYSELHWKIKRKGDNRGKTSGGRGGFVPFGMLENDARTRMTVIGGRGQEQGQEDGI